MNKVSYLGIDIGGAHIKVVGINAQKKITYVRYATCKIWEGTDNLREEFKKINQNLSNKSLKCGITMSGELCDNFKNRKNGAKKLIEECKMLRFEKYFYVNSPEVFSIKPKFEKLMSQNWHAIGKVLEKKIKDAILIDFGSTTIDFICIKNFKIQNKFNDDFSRLNNHELMYSGLTRTPVFGITNQIKLGNNKLNIIPEFFSNTADIYRVLNKLDKKIDLDDTADKSSKKINNSFQRISRSLGFDYSKELRGKVELISQKLSSIQLNQINNTISKLRKKFLLANAPIILSGIGQDVLKGFFEEKNLKTIYFKNFFKVSRLNQEASFHAPALSIALLLNELK